MNADPNEIKNIIQHVKNCSICGANDWKYSNKLFALTEFDSEYPRSWGSQIPMMAIICTNCHGMMLFYANPKALPK